MFRATTCPSSEENTVRMGHLAFFTLYRWLSGMQGGMKLIQSALHTSHLYRMKNARCRIRTVVCRAERNSVIPPSIPDNHLYGVTNIRCRVRMVFSSDDGHIVARNMYKKAMNILRKIVHQVGSIYKIRQECRFNKTWKRYGILYFTCISKEVLLVEEVR
jgi:hypothetical protein